MQQITPESGQRIDDRPLYVGLHRGTWPLYPGTPACSGNCAQGDKKCITPDACRLPDDEPASMGDGAGVFLWPLCMALVVFGVLAVVHLWSAA